MRLLFFLLLPIFASAQEIEIYKGTPLSIQPYGYSDGNCVPFTSVTDWVIVGEKSVQSDTCNHSFVYAENIDVNQYSPIILAVHSHCGQPTKSTEARICEHCFLHQQREKTSGMKFEKKNPSKYSQLLRQKSDN